MVITILEAIVPAGRQPALRDAYDSLTAAGLPPGLEVTLLLQDAADPTLWRILSMWASREALDRMRRDSVVPGGVQIFRAAGAEPRLLVCESRAEARASGAR